MIYKFRVWSSYHNKFVINDAEFSLIRWFETISTCLKGGFSRNEDYNTPCNIEDYEINQWTGLKDSAGQDIYEGDILSFKIAAITHGPEAEYITDAVVWYDYEYAIWCFGKCYDMTCNIDKNSILITGNKYTAET